MKRKREQWRREEKRRGGMWEEASQ